MTWDFPEQQVAIRDLVLDTLNGKLEGFGPPRNYSYIDFEHADNGSTDYLFPNVQLPGFDNEAFTAMWKAVYLNASAASLQELQTEMKRWMPHVFVNYSSSDS